MVQSKQKRKRGDFVALKGKTTFELTDVNTGEVEVIEDTNMITNALQEFLTTYGYFGCDVLDNNYLGNSSFWVNALGGLFLFDTALDEDVNNIFMPAGVKMIGNGSKDVSNSGAVTELGSYNATESGLQSDGSIKFVYDFSTQQANGTIACACLTSKVGGYMGMGNDNKKRLFSNDYTFRTFISASYYQRTSGISGSNRDIQHLLYAVYNENAIYFTNPYNIAYNSSYETQHWSYTKKIQILKVRAGLSSVSIKDRNILNNIIETYDVDIPQAILDYMGTNKYNVVICSDSEGNVYALFSKASSKADNFGLNAGSFCWMMKIDREMKATAYKITNNVGYGLDISRSIVAFNGDYMFAYAYNNGTYYLYGIKYSDSTQIIETGEGFSSRYNIFNIGRNLIGIFGAWYNSGSYYAPLVYDVVNNTLRYVNGKNNYSNELYIPFIDKKGVYISVYCQSSSNATNYFSVLKDPRYLATINNLSEPVVKTSSKTMKVTYTITEE